MNITLYQNYSEERVVNKNIIAISSEDVQYKGECNVLAPTLILKSFPSNCNYIYIQDLNRYYYVTDYSVSGTLYIVNLRIDVLMSYRTNISSLECLVDRQEFNVSEDIVDGEIIPLCTVDKGNILIGQCGDSNYRYYLSVIGI